MAVKRYSHPSQSLLKQKMTVPPLPFPPIDASDYGWCAVLCQRPEPGMAPKIVAIIAKGFTDVQQRWSAMERELYALW